MPEFNPNSSQIIMDRVTSLAIKAYFNVLIKIRAYRILVGKPEGKRPLGRPRHRWVNTIKMGLREIGWDGMDWIGLD
jgi:hypothetical protein